MVMSLCLAIPPLLFLTPLAPDRCVAVYYPSVCNLLSRECKKVIQRARPCQLSQSCMWGYHASCTLLTTRGRVHQDVESASNNGNPAPEPEKAVDIKIRGYIGLIALPWCRFDALKFSYWKEFYDRSYSKPSSDCISVCVVCTLATTRRFQHENRTLAGNQRMLLCHE